MSAGIKIFEKNSTNSVCEIKYRLMQEAADVIEPFMDSSRKIFFTADEMAMLVKRDLQHGGIVALDSLHPETVNAIRDLKPGAFFAFFQVPLNAVKDGFKENDAASQVPLLSSSLSSNGIGGRKILVTCWRGRGDLSINVMCNDQALYVIGQQLLSLGITVDFKNYTRAEKKDRSGTEMDGDMASKSCTVSTEDKGTSHSEE